MANCAVEEPKEMTMSKALDVYILSDSLGETAQYVARAAASQFPSQEVTYKHIPYVEDISYLKSVLEQIEPKKSILFFTLVSHDMRTFVQFCCDEANIATVDILSDAFSAIAEITGDEPIGVPGNIRRMDEAYFKKIEAIEFAIKYDDGKDAQGFRDADLVLIGISRTSKTPLSMYLAYKGIKVANLPLVPQVPIPDELYELPKGKIIGLMIRPDVLEKIRIQRLRELGVVGKNDYTDAMQILNELDYAEKIMKRIGCPVIDVSHKAVEETANTVMQIVFNLRGDNIID